jgi:SAM-dependent methyltransferase
MNKSDREFFENPGTWDAFTLTPVIEGKIRQLRAMIPPGAGRILDLGCGNGVVTNALAGEYRITGLDYSLAGLEAVRVPKLCASSTAVPLRPEQFDLLLCSELLEHLEELDLARTVAEILRLDAEYLLIAVPNNENIHLNEVRCPRCSRVFNASHHHRSFSRESLAALFRGYRVMDCRTGGMSVRNYPNALLRLRQRWGGRWFQVPAGRTVMCPECRNTAFPARPYNPISLLCDGINKIISRRRPYWLSLLLGKDRPASPA